MTDEGFINLIRRARELLTDVQIATRLRVSVPSIDRWARGKNLPHEALRDGVFDALASHHEDC